MKKFNIEQTEKDRILSLHESVKNKTLLNEQVDGYPIDRAIQRFLNDKYKANLKVDGQLYKRGSGYTESQKYIDRYQRELGVPVDGRFGDETKAAMPESDWKKLTDFYNKEKGWFDSKLTR